MKIQFDMEEILEIEHGLGKGSKKPKDDNAPKRPFTAYLMWANESRSSITAANPEFSMLEVGKEMGKLWKKLGDSKKAIFEAKARKEKKVYNEKYTKYCKTSSYKTYQKQLHAWKIHETKKPYPKDEKAPKKPLTAFMLYSAGNRGKVVKESPDLEATEIMKELGVWWKGLNEKEREPWMDKAAVLKKKYDQQLATYMRTTGYKNWASKRDKYKAIMLGKRNKLMGIKKRARSPTKIKSGISSPSKKKLKLSPSRSSSRRGVSKWKHKKSPSAHSKRSEERKSRAKRRSRTPKGSKRSASRSSSTKKSSRRSRTPKAKKSTSRSVSKNKSSSRSASRSSRSARTPKAPKRSTSRSASKRRSRTPKSKGKGSGRKSGSKSPKRRSRSRSSGKRSSRRSGKSKSKSPKKRKSKSPKKKKSKTKSPKKVKKKTGKSEKTMDAGPAE